MAERAAGLVPAVFVRSHIPGRLGQARPLAAHHSLLATFFRIIPVPLPPSWDAAMPTRLSLFALALAAGPLPAAEPSAAVGRMKTDLFYLAGEECNGRGVGTPGIDKAAEYVAARFKEAGLQPAGTDGYFQPFTFAGDPKLGSPNHVTVTGPGGQKLELAYADQFKPTADARTGKAAGGLVFAGFGIVSKQPAYDDYAGLDVKGKVVVVLRGTPQSEKENGPFPRRGANWAGSRSAKIESAAERGAAAVVFVSSGPEAKGGDRLLDVRDGAEETATVPVVHVKRAVLDVLLSARGRSLADVEAKIDRELKPQSLALDGWAADLETTVARERVPCKNVVGVLPGSGPLADETVVIGAHYDHLGTSSNGSLGGPSAEGKTHYGADDNGSGTTGLIELARRFAAVKDRVGRRLVFVAFSGEERGLFGSKHYVKQPAFPLASTAAMLNMDMIGRSVPQADKTAGGKEKDRLLVYGLGTAAGFRERVTTAAGAADFTLLLGDAGRGPSDHDSFYRAGVPVLFFFTGTHRDYHRPTDTPDKINYPTMARVVDYVQGLAEGLATGPRPKFTETSAGWQDPTDDTPRRAQGPRLGIMPGDYAEQDAGVLVGDVSPGGAAAAAGVKANDVIVEIAGKPVRNIGQYMRVMGEQKPGQELEIVVQRDGKRLTLKATPK
jgi:hypothetical protein